MLIPQTDRSEPDEAGRGVGCYSNNDGKHKCHVTSPCYREHCHMHIQVTVLTFFVFD